MWESGWNGRAAVPGTDEFGDYFVLLLFPSRFMDLYWFLCLDACAATSALVVGGGRWFDVLGMDDCM